MIKDAKMPKIAIQAEEESDQAVYELFGEVLN